MVVGIAKISLMLPSSETLKEKRNALRHIKDKVQAKFTAAIAEVGDTDMMQSAELGIAVVSNELAFTQSLIHKILLFIEDLAVAKVTGDEQDYINYGAEGLDAARDHWEPEGEDGGPLMRPPERPKKPIVAEDTNEPLPDWLPKRFLEGADPDKGKKS